MKLANARDAYGYNSEKLGNNIRTIALAGIAFIWVFSGQSTSANAIRIPDDLLRSGLLLVASLFLDLLQYAYATLIWGTYSRYKERRVANDADFSAPRAINWLSILFLVLKVLAAGSAYVLLGIAIATRLHILGA
jgi:hypothetical protein